MRITAFTLAIAVGVLASGVLASGFFASGAASAAPAGKHSVSGTVHAAAGKPARRHWVILDAGNRKWRYLTGDDGRYFLGFAAEGRYKIMVIRKGRQLFNADLRLPHKGPFDIRLGN